MMESDWQPARLARVHDVNSSSAGGAIIQYAAHGLVKGRADAVAGARWPAGEDGKIAIPNEFWEAIRTLSGSQYRDWQAGIFKFRRAAGANMYLNPIDVIGVEFDMATVRKALGVTDAPPLSGGTSDLRLKLLASDAGADRAKGGAPRDSDKWDAVTLALVSLSNDGKMDRGLDTRFKSAAEMRRAVLDDPGVSAMDVKEETIKPLIAKVFRHMLD
jgi:hypothetical protein